MPATHTLEALLGVSALELAELEDALQLLRRDDGDGLNRSGVERRGQEDARGEDLAASSLLESDQRTAAMSSCCEERWTPTTRLTWSVRGSPHGSARTDALTLELASETTSSGVVDHFDVRRVGGAAVKAIACVRQESSGRRTDRGCGC